MKKMIKVLISLLLIIMFVSYVLWPGNRVPSEDYEYIQNYYHLNIQDEGIWWYRYHGKYANTKSINDRSVFTLENNDIVLFSHGYKDEPSSIRINVSKSKEKLKEIYLKDIDRQDIDKVLEKDVVYKDINYNVEVYRNISENNNMYYSPIYIINFNYRDVYYYFEFQTEGYMTLDYKNDQQEINEDELKIYLDYTINTLAD